MFPKVPQSSQTESLGVPSYPPLNTPPLGTLQVYQQNPTEKNTRKTRPDSTRLLDFLGQRAGLRDPSQVEEGQLLQARNDHQQEKNKKRSW